MRVHHRLRRRPRRSVPLFTHFTLAWSDVYDGFFALFGLPRQIHSDRGKNFKSKLFQELCDLTGVQKSHTTAFHPQCDGQVERLNRTLLQMLRTTVQDNPHSWPQRLETLTAAYRMTVHKVTVVIPNMAMLGREVLFPTTLIARPPEEVSRAATPFVSNLRDNLRSPRASASGYAVNRSYPEKVL